MATPTFITYPVSGTNYVHPPFTSGISTLEVSLDGVIQSSSLYTITGGEVVFSVAPVGSFLDIKRVTSVDTRQTDYINTGILNETALDNDSLQAFYKLQELIDENSSDRLIKRNIALDDNWDAQAKRIENGITPVNSTDYATKGYVDIANTAAVIAGLPVTQVSDFTDFTDAITTLNGTGALTHLAITGVHSVPASLTVNSNITLWFLSAGRIDPAAGQTLTINGGIQAPFNLQIFGGLGTVAGNPTIEECSMSWFGGDPTGGTDSQPAFDAADEFMKTGGGIIRIGVGHWAMGDECLVSDGVHVEMSGRADQTGTSTIKGTDIFPLDSFMGTRMFAQKVTGGTSSKGIKFSNGTIRGDKPSGGNIDIGIEQENGKYWAYKNLAFAFFDLQAIYVSDNGSTVTTFEDILIRDAVQGTSLAAETGAIQLESQDNTLMNVEATTSSTSLAEAGKRIALLLTGTAAENFVFGGQFEISEIGIMVRGSGGNKFVGTRSDLNYMDGMQVRVGGNNLVACEFLNNGRAATNTYDGITLYANNNQLAACNARITTGNTHKYGFRDASGVAGNRCKACNSTGHGTAEEFEDVTTNFWQYDEIAQAVATADDTAPDVTGIRNLVIGSNTVRTRISSLTGKKTGQHLTIRNANGNDNFSYIFDSANFRLQKTWYPRNDDTLELYTNDGTVWNEVGRMDSPKIHTARMQFDTAMAGFTAIGDHVVGYLPQNAVIIDAFTVTQVIPTSGTSLATLAAGIQTDDPTGIAPATLVTNALWDLSNQGFHLQTPQEGTVTSYTTRTTGFRAVVFTVAVEVLTAGIIELFIKYIDLT